MLALMGEVGNFPMYEYITLKAEKEKIELRKINEHEDEWKQKINVNDELTVIKKVFFSLEQKVLVFLYKVRSFKLEQTVRELSI